MKEVLEEIPEEILKDYVKGFIKDSPELFLKDSLEDLLKELLKGFLKDLLKDSLKLNEVPLDSLTVPLTGPGKIFSGENPPPGRKTVDHLSPTS